MNFIQAKNEHLYPADRILSIGPSVTRGGDWIRELEIEGVGLVEVYGFRIEEFLRQPTQAFPAQPETYIVHLTNTETTGYWKTAVIGWSMARDGCLYPITAEGINDGLSNVQCLLTPDGRVSRAEDGNWNSLAVFLAEATGQDEGT